MTTPTYNFRIVDETQPGSLVIAVDAGIGEEVQLAIAEKVFGTPAMSALIEAALKARQEAKDVVGASGEVV